MLTENELTHSLADTSSDNSLVLILIIVVSSIATPLGFILGPLILKLNSKENTHYKIIIVLSILAVAINLYATIVFINRFIADIAISTS